MNRKGFTLIELIAVITILGIIALITVPIMYNSIKNAKEKMYEEQKLRIVDVAKKYALENEAIIRTDLEENYTQVITLEQLKADNYLEQKDIINPVNDEIMNGCILVKYTVSNDEFKYSYSNTCSFGNYYAEGTDLYYFHTKDSASETTLASFLADTNGVDMSSDYLNTSIKIYDDGNGYLFDKNGTPLTFYAGLMIEAENTSALLEVYRIFNSMALSDEDEEYSEAFGSFDIYIDATENIMLMVVDIAKAFGAGEITSRLLEEIQIDMVNNLENACNTMLNDVEDCMNITSLKHLKLDN